MSKCVVPHQNNIPQLLPLKRNLYPASTVPDQLLLLEENEDLERESRLSADMSHVGLSVAKSYSWVTSTNQRHIKRLERLKFHGIGLDVNWDKQVQLKVIW